MQFNDTKTVREIAIEQPGSTRVFEKLGIDYCCGGDRPLAQACQAAGVPVAEVMSSLEQIEASSHEPAESNDWQSLPLALLITHIIDRHHVFTREELDGIEPLLAKVCSVYGASRPELLHHRIL